MIPSGWLQALCLLAVAARARAGDYTALDRYVATPDASYRYTLARTSSSLGATVYQLDLVSQTWLTTAEVDLPEWHHWLTIIRPERVSTATAVLFIDGGSNTALPGAPDPLVVLLAAQSGAVVIDLEQVPNQPLRFAGETGSRSEDEIVAHTWSKFLQTGDERWPARLPMTKAAVRAMDAAMAFLASTQGGGVQVQNFIVAGASKRGWTAYTAAAVDPRVVAIAPVVIDTLNLEPAFIHHWRAYGFWAPAVRDYENAGVMNWFGTPQIQALLEIEDPYQYRTRLSLPKYLVCSTGDQFFLPDSSQFYFADLPGEKYLRYVPNTDHGMQSLEAIANLISWATAVMQNYPRPRFYWTADRAQGKLRVRAVDTPTKVLLWQANNPAARDFRLESIGAVWKSEPLAGEKGIYDASVAPAPGWTAFFVELTFPGPGGAPLVFTTEVVVTPDVYPFAAPPTATPIISGGAPPDGTATRSGLLH